MTLVAPNSHKPEYARAIATPNQGKMTRPGLVGRSPESSQSPAQMGDSMTSSLGVSAHYPLLEPLLRQKGLLLKGIYTIPDAAQIFETSKRTIQDWVRDGRLISRDLPGRGRFLSEDLELFLARSLNRSRVLYWPGKQGQEPPRYSQSFEGPNLPPLWVSRRDQRAGDWQPRGSADPAIGQ